MIRPARARPLSGDDRRSMIVDAVIPLLLEFGGDVTTRQIAQSAGIAEGTLFRAFGDKESIIQAAVDKFLDPEPVRAMMAAIDPSLPLRDKVHDILVFLQARTTGIMQIMSAVGAGRPPERGHGSDYVELLSAAFDRDRDRLRIDATDIAHFIRLVAFASSVGPLNEAHSFTVDELTELILNGITERDH